MGFNMGPLVLALSILGLLLLLLFFRFIWLVIRRSRQPQLGSDQKRDLLLDALKEKTVGERLALENKQAAALALESLDTLLRSIMRDLPVGVLVLEEDGRVYFSNPFFNQFTDQKAVPGQLLKDVSPVLFEQLTGIGRSGSNIQFSTTIKGQTKHVALAVNPIDEGRTLLTLVDKTVEWLLEERLRFKRDIELMGEMASGVTHEVKNALATIQGHVQLLPYGDVEENSEKIMSEIGRLLNFVNQFMSSSKDLELDMESIAIAPFLEEIADHWANHHLAHELVFEPVEDPSLRFTADRTMVAMVLDNLIRNGLESCQTVAPESPWVRVSVSSSRENISICVSDNGPGFQPEISQKMFMPFVSSKPKGTGLGLFHCRKVLLGHGGRLEVNPEPPVQLICHFPLVSEDTG